MAEIIIMPKLGFNMDEGQLVKWHRRVGETVKKGEVLFEINTDKTTMPVEATEDGTLLKIILEEGAFAEVFTPIAVTGAPGADPEAALAKLRADDPIENYARRCIAEGWLTREELDAVSQRVDVMVEEARRFAVESPYPDSSELYTDIYD